MKKAFTVVELLIVVVVIAILAAVTLVAYNGITAQARVASVMTTLRLAVEEIENAKTLNGGKVPDDIRSINNGAGFTNSQDDLLYLGMNGHYCIAARGTVNETYHVTDRNTQPQSGGCEGELVVSVPPQPTTGLAVLRALDIAYDSTNDTIVFASSKNGDYRKIVRLSADGTVSTVAGGAPGNSDGLGPAAQFANGANGLAVDRHGVIFVADELNSLIRKIDTAGNVTTIGGQRSAPEGYVDGPASVSMYNRPTDVFAAEDGTVYVGDLYGGKVRAISPDNVTRTVIAMRLAQTVAYDERTKDIYAMSSWTNFANTNILMRIPSATPSLIQLAGQPNPGFADGTGDKAHFAGPGRIDIDKSGNIYIGDGNNRRVRVSTPSGAVYTLVGNGEPGPAYGRGDESSLTPNGGIAHAPDGTMYLGSTVNPILKVTLDPR